VSSKLTDLHCRESADTLHRPEELRSRWSDAVQRAETSNNWLSGGLISSSSRCRLQGRTPTVRSALPSGLNAPVLTRLQTRYRNEETASGVLRITTLRKPRNPDDLLEKFTIDGELPFTLPDVLKVAPIWRHGNVAEIIGNLVAPISFGRCEATPNIAVCGLNNPMAITLQTVTERPGRGIIRHPWKTADYVFTRSAFIHICRAKHHFVQGVRSPELFLSLLFSLSVFATV